MCGRYTLTVDPAELMDRFELTTTDVVATPRFNIAPTQPVAVIYNESPQTLSSARWGLIPFWSKDPSIGSRMINARGETVAEKPAFRNLLKKRRCLVLADSFYEWRKNDDGSKTPMRLMLQSGQPFAFAGLWDSWNTPEGAALRTCTIITTSPNNLAAQVHDRMPVILSPTDEKSWLTSGPEELPFLQSLLKAYPAELMKAYPISSRVNSPKNEDATLIEAA